MKNYVANIIENFNFNSVSGSVGSIRSSMLNVYDIFVDLGLPSGTLWCKHNLGCNPIKLSLPDKTKPSDWYGNYYTWDEANLSENECNINNGLKTPSPEDEHEYVVNSKWHIPTYQQLKELTDCTKAKPVKTYMGVHGLNGYVLSSKLNNAQLFIPAAGYHNGSTVGGEGFGGYVWSSGLNIIDDGFAYFLYFYDSGTCIHSGTRSSGFSVRPVTNKQ